jgi:hypothetical protein
MNLCLTAINGGGTTTINVDVPITRVQPKAVMDNPGGHYVNIHIQGESGCRARPGGSTITAAILCVSDHLRPPLTPRR